jgi:hypothetical protein
MVGDYFYHESNINTKIRSNYGKRRADFVNFKRDVYDPYKSAQLTITGIDEAAIIEKVRLLTVYYNQVNLFNEGGWIKPTSKFRPTILEEFCGYLLKDLPKISELKLGFYNKKIFSGLAINSKGKVKIKTKDVDFCLGKHFDVTFGESVVDIIIPIIAIECKTYTDKTMLNEAQFTALKLKQGSPNTKVYILSEGNQVKDDEIPFKGQTPLDQIFILRELKDRALWTRQTKKEWEEINDKAVLDFFNLITTDLNSLLAEKEIPKFGGVILD